MKTLQERNKNMQIKVSQRSFDKTVSSRKIKVEKGGEKAT